VYEDTYEWLWLYAAVEPLTGESFFLLLPHVNAHCLQIFASRFGHEIAGRRVGLAMDGSGSHNCGGVVWPEGVLPMRLPPYSPELNPAEAVFRHLRSELSNQVFAGLAELEAAITTALQQFWDEPRSLQSLTGYPWWVQAAQHLMPSTS
jgi:transposase